MTAERMQQIERLFHSARHLDAGDRAAFLKEACGDEELRREVESLLAHQQQTTEFLDAPALEVAARALAADHARRRVKGQIGPYRILSPLGAGGVGEVYLAEDTRLARNVAIKFLSAEATADEHAQKRLIREAQAAAKLDHPNICAIHEVSEHEGRRFIVMQYVEGETLASRMQRQPLALRETLDIAAQMANALAEAHARGIVHRDIKPQNVMLTARGQVKVLDFGLAKVIPQGLALDSEAETVSQLTNPGVIMGTVPYMSPEQARGESVDYRSDIFSFGVMFYEMVSGQHPFVAGSKAETIAAILTREPEPLSSYCEIPAELERMVRQCLEKDRNRRYQTMNDLARALQSASKQDKAARATPPRGERASASDLARRTARQARWRNVLTSQRYLIIAAMAGALLVAYPAYKLLFHGAPAPPEIKSLAVLPLDNLSGDPAQEYFTDGMTEALISNLAQVRGLRVISRTSVMRYKESRKSLPEIARELNVDAVIEGSVQRSSGRVRVTAQLIPAATDTHVVWSRSYEREMADVLKLQSEVARAVADEIRVQVTAPERARLASARSINPQAHEAYLLGRFHLRSLNEEDLKRAIDHFERAIQLAPDYAAAYAGLAASWQERGVWGTKELREVEAPARQAAAKAIELDAGNAEARVALAQVKYSYDWDWAGAEEEFKRALDLDPGSLYAHWYYATLLMALGRFPEAFAEIENAERLDPLSSFIQSGFGRILYRARQYEEAIPRFKRAIELDPRSHGAYGRLGDVYTEMGRYDEALAMYEKVRTLRPDGGGFLAGIARVYALTSRRREALEVVNRAKVGAFGAATVYAALGDRDAAFKVLEKAVEERDLLVFIKADPRLDDLHADARWEKLLRRMNFPPG